MTTLMLVDGQRGEGRANAIIRRLRMEFARLGLSDSEAARRAGLSQDRMSRRMTGKTPFDVNDLDVICESLNISFGYVMTGARPIPGNDGPDGDGGVVRPKGFEPLTFWSGVSTMSEVRFSRHLPILTLPVRAA
ncbi:Uncharacterised protein [Mycobacteroides abscessus subsp. abscessus]|uniref:helix-turn-helix domain-containing protein n=2 Tax=Mycobacteroides abscessus TaxID=36809 RepID=UPI0009290329|nr:helix-turn-helix transcriptional regulator [Mycobacteroides abscessus]SIK17187.1 Uncharacterised protein [Mycobacteroides abscessus subsp. abscessus]SLC96662.1 Uncharacterised protein [Mycobacteroides abscessus subsp. massiliense]SLD96256.1 Uncharacterised protein [Mycobacteroides abscessus subsp. massiliense]SLF29552.1 Uncharacterised protein [Mycobacteroides abscessus subsp. massiliense]